MATLFTSIRHQLQQAVGGSWICYAGGVPCIPQKRNTSLSVCGLGLIHVTVALTDSSMRFINTDLELLLDFDAVEALLSSSAVSRSQDKTLKSQVKNHAE